MLLVIIVILKELLYYILRVIFPISDVSDVLYWAQGRFGSGFRVLV